MKQYLIDANLIRYIARKQPGWIHIAMSAVVYYELMVAADNLVLTPEERKGISDLAADFVTLEFDVVAAVHAAMVKTGKNRIGKPSQKDAVDTMLAGHALALGATVATHNVKDFARVPGLAVEDWLQPLGP